MIVLSRLLKEPISHFILLSILIFLVNSWFEGAKNEQLVIDQQTQNYLINYQEELQLRTLSNQEKQEIIQEYVNEELLLHEAYKRELDKGDSRIRRIMLRKITRIVMGEITEPTNIELRQFYDNNPKKFIDAEQYSLEQVFYKDTSTIPQDIHKQLDEGVDFKTLGDQLTNSTRYPLIVTKKNLVRGLGSKAADTITNINDNAWHGPIESIQGLHFIRIANRIPEQPIRYEEVQHNIANLWRFDQTEQKLAQALKEIRKNYDVIVSAKVNP